MSNWLIARNRNYRLLFSGSLSSNLADGISVVALPWLATILSDDPVMIAMVAAAQRLPWFLFALPIGQNADRQGKKKPGQPLGRGDHCDHHRIIGQYGRKPRQGHD